MRDLPGKTVPLDIERSGEPLELQVTLADRNPGTGERGIGFLGVSPAVDVTYVKRNVPEAVQRSFTEFGTQVGGTVVGIGRIFSPAGLNKLWQTVTGQRPDDPTQRASSIVGIVREGGRAADSGVDLLRRLLGAVNLSLGLFNLLPLLPFDGGHIVIATYERLRSRKGRVYRVDMAKVMPIFVVPLIILFTVVMGSFWLDITGPLSRSDRSTSRRPTRQIMVGKVPVGGGAPITVQSMTITKTADVEGTLQQIYALAAAGCDIVRCTCNEPEAAEGLAQIVPRSPVPIIADIHHQYRMALAALEAGVHGLRLNPGNIRQPEHIKAVADRGPRPRGLDPHRRQRRLARSAACTRSTAASRPRRWSSRRCARWPTSRRSTSTSSRSRSRPRACR